MITCANNVGQNPTKQYVRDDLNAKLFYTDGSLHMLSLKNKSTKDKTPHSKSQEMVHLEVSISALLVFSPNIALIGYIESVYFNYTYSYNFTRLCIHVYVS